MKKTHIMSWFDEWLDNGKSFSGAEDLDGLDGLAAELAGPDAAEAAAERLREEAAATRANPLLLERAMDEFLALVAKRNDTGNSERLELRYGDRMRFVSGSWAVFDGKAWQRDSDHLAVEIMKDVNRQTEREADTLDDQARGRELSEHEKHARFALRSGQEGAILSAVKLAASSLREEEAIFDKNPTLLNVQNGVVDLLTGRLLPHDRSLMLTGIASVDYDPDADTSEVEAVVGEIMCRKGGGVDAEKMNFLQCFLGQAVRGDNVEKAILVLTGDETDEERNGDNGKTALANFILDAMGNLAGSCDKTALVKSSGRSPDNKSRLPMRGKRISYMAELGNRDIVDGAALKLITGGEEGSPMKSLYKDEFFGKIGATPILTSNVFPQVDTNDAAVWGRIYKLNLYGFFYKPDASARAIASGYSVPRNPAKIASLRNDPAFARAFLKWIVDGAVKYHKSGLPLYEPARASLEIAKEKTDPFSRFTDACVSRTPGAVIKAADLYMAYLTHCALNGEAPESQKAFGSSMTAKGYTSANKGGYTVRENVGLTPIGFAYANGLTPESALDFVAVNEGSGVAYPGINIPPNEIRGHFKIGKDGMKVGDIYGPYRIERFGGYEPLEDDLIERLRGYATTGKRAAARRK